jgi:perosamine synthetase
MHDTIPCGRHSPDEVAVLGALRGDELAAQYLLELFEEDLAVWTAGVSCAAVNSAGAAAHVAYAATGLSLGDEVITAPLADLATAATAAELGARLVFVDVDDDTLNLDPGAVGAAASWRTRVVAATDLFGHPAEYDDLRAVTDALDAVLIGVSGPALGATYRSVPVGALADLTAFSSLALGMAGGAVAVADEAMLNAARRFRAQGRDHDGLARTFGLDYEPPAVLCALGRARLRTLSRRRARHTELVERYGKLLDDVPGLRLPVRREWVDPAWHTYAVRVPDGRRDHVAAQLRSAGIEPGSIDVPLYWQPVFADLGYRRGLCPNAERFHAEQLCLPLYAELTDAEQDHIVDTVRAALG